MEEIDIDEVNIQDYELAWVDFELWYLKYSSDKLHWSKLDDEQSILNKFQNLHFGFKLGIYLIYLKQAIPELYYETVTQDMRHEDFLIYAESTITNGFRLKNEQLGHKSKS